MTLIDWIGITVQTEHDIARPNKQHVEMVGIAHENSFKLTVCPVMGSRNAMWQFSLKAKRGIYYGLGSEH
jgi:hypothetical protein